MGGVNGEPLQVTDKFSKFDPKTIPMFKSCLFLCMLSISLSGWCQSGSLIVQSTVDQLFESQL
jgi:hypothetical protein